MPPFKDPRTYRDILDALQIGVSVAENIDSRIACDLFCDVTPEKNFLAQIQHRRPKPYATTGNYRLRRKRRKIPTKASPPRQKKTLPRKNSDPRPRH